MKNSISVTWSRVKKEWMVTMPATRFIPLEFSEVSVADFVKDVHLAVRQAREKKIKGAKP